MQLEARSARRTRTARHKKGASPAAGSGGSAARPDTGAAAGSCAASNGGKIRGREQPVKELAQLLPPQTLTDAERLLDASRLEAAKAAVEANRRKAEEADFQAEQMFCTCGSSKTSSQAATRPCWGDQSTCTGELSCGQ